MIAPSEFQRYLQLIFDASREDTQQEVRDRYISTLAELPLQVQTCASSKADSQEKQEERREQFAVLEGLRKYAPEHVLLVGKPGSGKSTSLRRLLWEEAGRCLEAIEHNLKNLPLIPVLVELRECRDGSVLRLIQKRLQRQRLRLNLEEIEDLLFEGCFLLLLDGLNELPNQDAWQAVNDFRQNYPDVPMVFTTRELGSGSGLGIAKKLEMLPLTETQMREFVQKQLPETGGELWRQIKGRLRELAETPLLLKLLCDVFEQNRGIPENRGDLFRREFARRYEEFKPERLRNVSEDSRRFAFDLLSYLAFKMVQGELHTDPCKPSASWITIPKTQAEKILAAFLAGDRTPDVADIAKAKEWLEDLLEWDLLQVASDRDRIEFHHQLFQEYYAAEWLLPKLAELSDDELKYYYLNYLKWTEVIAFMLALIDEQDFGGRGREQAVRVVKLALEADSKFPAVDLILGARLAGEVKLKFQQKTVRMIAGQEVPEWFRIFLLGETKSPKAADELIKTIKTIKHPNPAIRSKAVWATRQLGSEASKPIIFEAAIKDSDPHVRETAIRVVGEVIGQLDSEQVIPLVTQILTKELIASVREAAVMNVLIKLDSEAAVLELFRAIEDPHNNVRTMAVYHLDKINVQTLIAASLEGVKNVDPSLRKNAAHCLGRLSAKMDICYIWDLSNLSPDVYDEYFVAFCLAKIEMEKDKTITENQDKERENTINYWFKHLNSEEDTLRGNAIYNLAGWLDKEEAIRIVKKALDDPHHYVRGHGISSLARLIGKEAIPELIKALDDRHYDVREKAAEILTSLGQNLPDSLEIPEETVSKLIQILNEEQNTYIHSVTIRTLTNLCSIQQSLVLREDLESAFLNASNASVLNESYALDIFLRSSAASGLRKFKSERVSSRLVQMVGDSDFSVALSATESLKNMPPLISAKYLPALIELNLNSAEGLEGIALGAIFAIQSSCGFYNYDIAQLTPPQKTKNERCREKYLLHSKLDMITQEFKKVSEEPKRIIHTQSYFEKGTHTHTHHYANDEALKQHIPEVRQLVHQLQQTHQPTTEVQAAEIIDVEFREIQKTNPTRWQTIRKQLQLLKRQLLNPESHLKATKATLAEVAKHYLEESVVSKALITYLDTMSAETDQGE